MEQKKEKKTLYYPVPRLMLQPNQAAPIPLATCPAMMSYIIRVQDTDTDGAPLDLLYFYIERDKSTPLRSFTITYRFSALPVMLPDPLHPFYTYTYTDDDINDDNAYIVCKFTLPPERAAEFPGCSAFISESVTASGEVISTSAAELAYTDEDMEKLSKVISCYYEANAPHTADVPAQSDEEETYNALLATENEKTRQSKKVRLWTRVAGYALLVCVLLASIWTASSYLTYQKAMIGVEVYLDAGEYAQAQDYIKDTCGFNLFYLSRKKEMNATVDSLLSEKRYNEAFKIATLIPDTDLLQRVCREAAACALSGGDYSTAYVYAHGAPAPFDAEIIALALDAVLDPGASSFDENAYLVARKTTDEAAQNEVLLKLIAHACDTLDYPVAMEAARAVTDTDIRAKNVTEIFDIATRYYIDQKEFQMAADFISRYAEGNTISDDIREALVSFFSESSNSGSAFFLAKHFGIDASHISVDAEDNAVSADIAGVYPLLTESQKRVYHARRIAVSGMTFVINDSGSVTLVSKSSGARPASGDTSTKNAQSRIDALLSDKTVVSIASNDLVTACLHPDGTVTVFSNHIVGNQALQQSAPESRLIEASREMKNVISVVVGNEHVVYLHADGTVSASGDNSRGQCNTEDWRDIAAIAAGKHFTVALKQDGTVVACGDNGAGQCDTSSFANVKAIAACDRTAVALFVDGTVGLAGERSMGIADAESLNGVKRIRAGGSAIITESADGTYQICGSGAASGNYGSAASWNSIIDYDVGSLSAAALQANGDVRATGTNRPKQ